MAGKRHLTDRLLKALAPAKPGERYELRDSIVAGFGVRVNDERDPSRPGKAGHVSFIRRFSIRTSARVSLSWRASALSSLTSSEVASRAVSPASRFLPASRNSFDQR